MAGQVGRIVVDGAYYALLEDETERWWTAVDGLASDRCIEAARQLAEIRRRRRPTLAEATAAWREAAQPVGDPALCAQLDAIPRTPY